MNKVILLRGVAGSGKSTWIKNNLVNYELCSADNFFIDSNGTYKWEPNKIGLAHDYCFNKFKTALENNVKLVVVDNTNTKLKEMERYIKIAKDFGYEIKIVRMNVPIKVLYGRNVHGVPDTVVDNMYKRMQDIPEAWDIKEILVDGNL